MFQSCDWILNLCHCLTGFWQTFFELFAFHIFNNLLQILSDEYSSNVKLRSIRTTTKEPPDYRDYDSPAYEDVS